MDTVSRGSVAVAPFAHRHAEALFEIGTESRWTFPTAPIRKRPDLDVPAGQENEDLLELRLADFRKDRASGRREVFHHRQPP